MTINPVRSESCIPVLLGNGDASNDAGNYSDICIDACSDGADFNEGVSDGDEFIDRGDDVKDGEIEDGASFDDRGGDECDDRNDDLDEGYVEDEVEAKVLSIIEVEAEQDVAQLEKGKSPSRQ